MNKLLDRYNHERDIAVISMDVETFRAFYSKWYKAGILNIPLTNKDYVVEIIMRKMAVNITSIPAEVKDEAEKWLLDRGMDIYL